MKSHVNTLLLKFDFCAETQVGFLFGFFRKFLASIFSLLFGHIAIDCAVTCNCDDRSKLWVSYDQFNNIFIVINIFHIFYWWKWDGHLEMIRGFASSRNLKSYCQYCHSVIMSSSLCWFLIAFFVFYFHIDDSVLFFTESQVPFFYENNKSFNCHHKANTIVIFAIKCIIHCLQGVVLFCVWTCACFFTYD